MSAIMYALIVGLIPSFIWLYFWTREDLRHPEPKSLIAGSFLAGSIAVIVAIFAEKYVATFVSDPTLRYSIWAGIEEVLKFIAVAIVALRSADNDEPIDAMVYSIVVALGFAALENMLFLLGPLSSGEIARSIVTGNMRFIGATLVHIACSASIGFALGITFYKKKIIKILAATIGLGVAILLHASFNISIINADSGDTLKTFGWVWGAIIILIILFEEVKVVRPKVL
jgi:RsiW-degrading membrane proteinase PrsW (M82 family)